MEKKYCLKIKELLENKEISRRLANTYVDTDKARYEGDCIDSHGYSIILYFDSSIEVVYRELNYNLELEEGFEVFHIRDESINVTDSDMGHIEDEVKDYKDFIDYLKTVHGEYWEDYIDWSEYYNYNEDNFYSIQREAWEELCNQYDYNYAYNRINHLIEELSEENCELI